MWRRQRFNYTCCFPDYSNMHPGFDGLPEYELLTLQMPQNHWTSNPLDWYNYSYLPSYQPYYSQPFEDLSLVTEPYLYNYFPETDLNNNEFDVQDGPFLYEQDAWGEPQQPFAYPYFETTSFPMFTMPYASLHDRYGDEPELNFEDFYLQDFNKFPLCCPVVTSCGTLSILLKHCVRVDITVDRAIRMVNFPANCIASINGAADYSGILHPYGRILQEGVTINAEMGKILAKIAKRGVTFTSTEHSLVYLVDPSGTKSTTERFQDLNYDFSINLFYLSSFNGTGALNYCFDALAGAYHRVFRNGDEVWNIAGVRIKQTSWGDVRVTKDYGRRVLRTSPTSGNISVSTPFVHMAAGCEPDRCVFVRRGDKRVIAHIGGFNVRCGSQKAGFDEIGRLILN
ncbi:uncharacterized protein LOC143235470 [Tachypleus tridentatus]|uniref:uncharacterized protein LOC143235470 n=1 Tax=Tachypleus tridentatus TaxID=6853 RepID=UPI003FD58B4B